jgi:hypothetical protein
VPSVWPGLVWVSHNGSQNSNSPESKTTCYGLDLECSPKAHRLRVLHQIVALCEVEETLRGGQGRKLGPWGEGLFLKILGPYSLNSLSLFFLVTMK